MSDALNKPTLACPHCGYALRGHAPDAQHIIRCPECGGMTTLIAIVDEHQRRRKQFDQLLLAIAIVILAMPFLAIVMPAVDEMLERAARVGVVRLLIGAGLVYLIIWKYRDRLGVIACFAATAGAIPLLLAAAPPARWPLLLLSLWLGAVHLWARLAR